MAPEPDTLLEWLKKWTLRVAAGVALLAIGSCAAGVIRNGNRLTALETHIPYIREALDRIEKRLRAIP